jgi:hypothetical protein
MLAETEDALRAKVRQAIAEGWYPDEDGPLPEDFSELVDRYQERSDDTCYFGDYTYTVLDSALCEPLPE